MHWSYCSLAPNHQSPPCSSYLGRWLPWELTIRVPRSAWQHAQRWPCWRDRGWPPSEPAVAVPPQPASSSPPMPQGDLPHLKTHNVLNIFVLNKHKHLFAFYVILRHQSFLKFTSRENTNPVYIVHTTAADDLAMQGSTTSTAILVT